MFLQKGEAAMKIQPTLDEVKTTAAAGRYEGLPVSCEILADICTPIEALKISQFSPFAALTGHEAAIKETARRTDEKLMLSDEVIAEINVKLNLIAETIGTQQRIRITYFVPDNKKAGGAYISCSGCVKKIDEYEHTVVMEDKTVIPIEQISNIEGEMFGDMF